jgi:N-acetylneuraminate synthase
MILKDYIKNNKVCVIAEIGVNHNGKLSIAKKLIKIAKRSGADVVKFQNFNSNDLVTMSAKKAKYQKLNTKNNNSQYSMLKMLELKNKDYFELKKLANSLKLGFLSSPFDNKSLSFLQNELKINTIKIPSGEITNFKLLSKLKNNSVILSTGMSNLNEIAEAINVIFHKKIYSIKKEIKIIDKKFYNKIYDKIIILHCVSDYPVKESFANLLAIKQIKDTFQLRVGFSDHTSELLAPSIAVVLGCVVIEKHLTINKKLEGPDHRASLNPIEFSQMVNQIRRVELMLGDGIKKLEKCEINTRKIARKSLVALKNIKKKEKFTEKNLTTKRPGTGVPASQFFKYIGTRSKKNYKINDLIKE